MGQEWRSETVMQADLVSLQDYLEERHGPAIAQILIDDLATQETIQQAA